MSKLEPPTHRLPPILPCPFCGFAKPYFYQRWAIECHQCGCGYFGPEFAGEEEAIAFWNAAGRLSGPKMKRQRAEYLKACRAERQRIRRARAEREAQEAPRRAKEVRPRHLVIPPPPEVRKGMVL